MEFVKKPCGEIEMAWLGVALEYSRGEVCGFMEPCYLAAISSHSLIVGLVYHPLWY